MKTLITKASLLFSLSAILFSCGGKTEKKEAVSETTADTQLAIEKPQLTFGFIKLTDMAPLAIAKEKGFFEDEGLFVTLQAQSNWKNALDGVTDGVIDGSHLLAGQPVAAAAGFGKQSDLVTVYNMGLNGNAITISNDVWAKMKPNVAKDGDGKPTHPINASALKMVVDEYKRAGKTVKMAMTFPVSTHNFELRYYLASGGINPGMYTKDNIQGQVDADVLLSVTPPPQMVATMSAGTIQGYCVGEPWNQQAVANGIGVPIATTLDIYKNKAEKVFGLKKEFTEKYPNTTVAIVKALIRAGKWLDDPKNRLEAVEIISRKDYVGADKAVIAKSMTGTFEYEKGDIRPMPDFNVFYKYDATYPFYSDGVWFLTQMRRWGQISEAKPAAWYDETIKKVYRPDIWKKAAELLVEEGKIPASDIPTTDGYKSASSDFIDGITYDGKDPVGYLNSFSIGNKG
jgi:nitrate/nitrite transport system substrate-binding protein